MLPAEITRAFAEKEVQAAALWAQRHDVPLTWDLANLRIRATLVQPSTGEHFYLQGDCEGYREVPPAWQWADKGFATFDLPNLAPRAGLSQPPWGSIVFHASGVICAPFNRLAYKFGPHLGLHANDWGDAVQWLSVTGEFARAYTLGDMLQVIFRDLQYTNGRLA